MKTKIKKQKCKIFKGTKITEINKFMENKNITAVENLCISKNENEETHLIVYYN